MKKLWDIPYSDTRPRCAKCLRVFKKGERGRKSGLPTIMRFTRICNLCAPEYFGKEEIEEPELTLNNPAKITLKDLHL